MCAPELCLEALARRKGRDANPSRDAENFRIDRHVRFPEECAIQ
jgi:hypothetical protein